MPRFQAEKVLRVTFAVRGGEVRLESAERLEMILPPPVGERPRKGRNGGYWMEVLDQAGNSLFHHLLDYPLRNSAELYSPNHIERVFGEPMDGHFEILVPDDPRARELVLIGIPPHVQPDHGGATELARFAFPQGGTE
ncbi:MAG TPA: hypothetical protein VEO54_17605 [Thermoanaerobaculia bacterium]|nr:hypothetical protein [Thermoanaerobaculia bacterium]